MVEPVEDLDAFLSAEFDAPELPEDRDRFRITNDRMAAWAQHQLGLRRQEVERVTELAADRIDVIRAWKDQATAGPLRDVAFFEAILVEYVRPLIEKELHPLLDQGLSLEDAWARVRQKGYPLPEGRVQGRKKGGGPAVDDDVAFVAWAIASERLDLIRSEPAKAALNTEAVVKDGAVYTADGVRIPGVSADPVRIEYSA